MTAWSKLQLFHFDFYQENQCPTIHPRQYNSGDRDNQSCAAVQIDE